MSVATPDVSIVLPVFNEEGGLPELHRRLTSVLTGAGLSYEVIFINDGSLDGSWARILELGNADRHVRGVNLSRNFGHQVAITAGVELSRGDTVVVMDSDMQDPPELVPTLYAKHKEGFDVVYAQRRTRDGETWFKNLTAKMFYRLIRRMATIDIPVDTGDFRLMSRRVVDDLRRLQERHRFVRGLVTWIGYNQTPVLYDRAPRAGGTTKYPIGNMVRFALDGFTGFSSQPLRLASHVGAFFAFASLALMVTLTIYKLAGGQGLVTGWTSLAVAVLFLGGVQLLAIGILGEYIGRIYEEVKGRPLYLVRDSINVERLGVTDAAFECPCTLTVRPVEWAIASTPATTSIRRCTMVGLCSVSGTRASCCCWIRSSHPEKVRPSWTSAAGRACAARISPHAAPLSLASTPMPTQRSLPVAHTVARPFSLSRVTSMTSRSGRDVSTKPSASK